MMISSSLRCSSRSFDAYWNSWPGRHINNAETDAGKRVAHHVTCNYLDNNELEAANNVLKNHTPAQFVGYTIGDA